MLALTACCARRDSNNTYPPYDRCMTMRNVSSDVFLRGHLPFIPRSQGMCRPTNAQLLKRPQPAFNKQFSNRFDDMSKIYLRSRQMLPANHLTNEAARTEIATADFSTGPYMCGKSVGFSGAGVLPTGAGASYLGHKTNASPSVEQGTQG
jgi:hypothetical protein